MKAKEVFFLYFDFLAPSWLCKCGERHQSCLVGRELFRKTRNWLSKYEWSFQGRPQILRSYFTIFNKFKSWATQWWRRGLFIVNYKELLVQKNRCICRVALTLLTAISCGLLRVPVLRLDRCAYWSQEETQLGKIQWTFMVIIMRQEHFKILHY